MLANAGHISDALASAEEPRVPQACSALRVLEQSLKTGTSFDIVFQAYTRRLSPGKVTRPIPIYASTAVLKTTTLLLDPTVEENLDFSSLFELSEGDTLPSTSIESYEYESDSDLEDNDDNHSSNHNNVAVVQPAEEVDTQAGDEASASHDERSHTPESREGLFILVKGVAWRTWHAFIYYCYTGIANFANLRSQSMPDGVTLQQRPHCSPKSMYQLARKLQNEPLSQLAFKAIETRLSAANILDEAFSKFTSRHDAIREMEITLLLQHQSAPAVLQGLPAKIKAVAMGDLPHAALAFTALYQKITQIPAQN
ncbi:hypothetical protein EV702DRAFT_968983 [Suillus placidus]|uniref:Uncharacterized protein n=1 Tax=Suillus placidus TaxID=48579 RepID=A0A9P7D324_9AGAM|nr:hypothetical protein EV702DRAFT_968983 [Suillus placidus]